jgi:hypothetical protein
MGGLNKYTRQRIDGQLTLPADYNAFVRMFQTLGNQFESSYVHNNDNNKGNAMEWEPVKIITVKTAPTVSREQRQAWKDKDKCVRCGSGKHWISDCDYQLTRNRSFSFSSLSSDGNGKTTINIGAVRIGRTKTTARLEYLGKDKNKNNGNGSELETE